MENYALSIANYFIRLAKGEDKVIRPLKLMKLVYIAHGYMLALLDRPTDGAKLEKVEAWQYGPVFPSVYYSFNKYGRRPITEEAKVINFDAVDSPGDIFTIPIITEEIEQKICRLVWEKYGIYTDSTLVDTLHADGTPWRKVYVKGLNRVIPDYITKSYYRFVIKKTMES